MGVSLKSINLAEKGKKKSSFSHPGLRQLLLLGRGVREDFSIYFPLGRNYSVAERMCWNPLAWNMPEGPCRNKRCVLDQLPSWTQLFCDRPYFSFGPNWSQIPWGSLLDCGAMNEIRDRDSMVA